MAKLMMFGLDWGCSAQFDTATFITTPLEKDCSLEDSWMSGERHAKKGEISALLYDPDEVR